MAVTLSPADVARLGPDAKRQLRSVKADERPAAPAPAAAKERRPRANPRRAVAGVRTGARYAARGNRAAGRGIGIVRGNVSVDGVFGIITGAALVGALLYRADTITPLLGHMVSAWQQVIALGKGK